MFEQGTTREHNVVSVAVKLENLCSNSLANVWSQIANTSQFDKRGWQESTKSDVDDQAALDNFDNKAFNCSVNGLDLLNVSPCTLVLRALLGKQQATFFVLKRDDKRFNLFAKLDDFIWVNIITNRQLARENDAFGFVTNLDENFVASDSDNRSGDELTIFKFYKGSVNRVGKRLPKIAFCYLTWGVISLCVEGAHWRGLQCL